nr:molybdenum cofactor biosynthesis protein MoaE [Eikenella sp. NML080894]
MRRQNDGQRVNYLVYGVYEELACCQGRAVIEEAKRCFGLEAAVCVYHYRWLEVGGMAVWVGVTTCHHDMAFAGCRYVIDMVKAEELIWE